jgi:PKHD-type hydroxylase
MQLFNNYYSFNSALSPEQCEKIINIGNKKIQELKNKGVNTAAVTFGNTQKKNNSTDEIPLENKTIEELNTIENVNLDKVYVRDSEVCWLEDQWLYDLINPYIHEANKKAGWKYDIDYGESFQFTKYGLNQFYGWHMDGGSDHYDIYKRAIPGITLKKNESLYEKKYTENKNYIGKIRKLSATINLTFPYDYEGGNLKFDFGPHYTGERYHECTEIRPQGSIIVFPSFLYHQVTPITKGTRYSLVLWMLGLPFK